MVAMSYWLRLMRTFIKKHLDRPWQESPVSKVMEEDLCRLSIYFLFAKKSLIFRRKKTESGGE